MTNLNEYKIPAVNIICSHIFNYTMLLPIGSKFRTIETD